MNRRNNIRRKSDVETHGVGFSSRAWPALNVKAYHFGPDESDVMARYGCDSKTAEKALRFAWESAVERFWESATQYVAEIFPGVKCYSEGRSGGWLIAHGLEDPEEWDAVTLAKWRKLARMIDSELAWLCDPANVHEDIAANQWAKPGAELYNFIDGADGETHCIADMKAEAAAAGFAPVVRV